MKNYAAQSAILVVLAVSAVACSSSSSPHSTGGNDAGGGSGGALSFNGSGTFTATTSAGSVSAAIGPVISLDGSPSFPGSFTFFIGDQGSLVPSGGTLTFSSPSGITSSQFAVSIGFPGTAPTTGTFTQDTSGFCGTLSMTYSNDAQTTNDAFSAGASSCPQTPPVNTGTWSLTLSSLTLGPTANTTVHYTAHGSFTASMLDGAGNTGTVSLTF